MNVYLVASGDLRQSANEVCWPAQHALEQALGAVLAKHGARLVRAHPYDPKRRHGFIASQKEGMEVFARLDPTAPLIVAEAVWQDSHHVLAGLVSHRGPILTVANWSGTWPGLVGMLNLNGSLTKAGVRYSTLWSERFEDDFFLRGLRQWLRTGRVRHATSHVRPFARAKVPAKATALARRLAAELRTRKAILGVFDEGCMGMYNAIIPDELLFPLGVYKERLSQSALYAAAQLVSEEEARAAFAWLQRKGMKFHLGQDEATELTENQVLWQCRTYIAAARLGLQANLTWFHGREYAAQQLIQDVLLPMARAGLESAKLDSGDIDRYLGIVAERCKRGRTGARWALDSLSAMGEKGTKDQRMGALVRAMQARQQSGEPVHTWALADPGEFEAWKESYVQVGQFMTTDLFTVHPEDVVDLAASLMDWRHIRHVPVEDNEGKLVGLVSHRTLLRLVGQGMRGAERTPVAVKDIMIGDPVTVTPSTPTLEAIELMRRHKIGSLPVVEEGNRLVGIITERDLIRVAAMLFEKHLRDSNEQ
jgi:CBS domain-containing protein